MNILRSIFNKSFIKKDVYRSYEQCMRPTEQCIIPLVSLFTKKKKKRKSETQNAKCWIFICIQTDTKPLFGFTFHHVCVLFFFFFFFFFHVFLEEWTVAANVDFFSEQCIRALFTDPQISFFINFFIKNGSHGTIYTFKNYFTTVISAISFQFQQNKSYPNRP